MAHALVLEPVGEVAGDIGRAVVAEKRGLWTTSTLSQPDAARARSSVSVTSSARMVVQSFQAMMYREWSSRIVER
jgi:hypothetical protein